MSSKFFFLWGGLKRNRFVFLLPAFCFLFFFRSSKLDGLLIDGSNTVKHLNTPQVFDGTGDLIRGCASLKGGCDLAGGAGIIFDTIGVLNGSVNDSFSGAIMVLGGDLTLGSTVSINQGLNIKGYGHSLILTSSLLIPNTKTFKITADGGSVGDGDLILNGMGNYIDLQGIIEVDADTTLTIRNAILGINASNDTGNGQFKIALAGGGTTVGRLALQNVDIRLSGHNLKFEAMGGSADHKGEFFIHDNVTVSGYGKTFDYQSACPMFIAADSMLYFDVGTTFNYAPGDGSGTDRSLVRMVDATSVLYLNGCVLNANGGNPCDGLQLTKGTVIFDNKVVIDNDGNTDVTKSFELGDGTNPVTVAVLGGARVEVDGYLYHNP
jgi:hypothetical protein